MACSFPSCYHFLCVQLVCSPLRTADLWFVFLSTGSTKVSYMTKSYQWKQGKQHQIRKFSTVNKKNEASQPLPVIHLTNQRRNEKDRALKWSKASWIRCIFLKNQNSRTKKWTLALYLLQALRQSSVYVELLTQLVLFQHLHKQTKKKLKTNYF